MAKGKEPIGNGANGRNTKGQFTKGNPGGPGNPYVKKAAELKNALYDAVTQDDINEVVAKMLEQAKDGDAAARKELFDRVFGKPTQPVDLGGEGGRLEIVMDFDTIKSNG